MDQWAAAVVEQLGKDREADNATVRRYLKTELAEQMEEHKTFIRQLREDLDRQVPFQDPRNMEQEIVDRVQRLEEEMKRRGKDMNRGDEMRVTSAINEMRREVEQHLSCDGHDGRFQAIEKTIDGITAKCTQLQNAVSDLERSSRVGSPFNHHRDLKLCHQGLVVGVT